MSEVLTLLLEHSSSAVVAVLMTLLWMRKDNELTTERAARVADAKDFTKLALELQNRVMDATNKLSDVFDAIRREKS